MSFSEAISDGFAKYAVFSGRSSLSAYWYWTLFAALVYTATLLIDSILGTGFIYLIAAVALFLPGLAVLIRRLHDADHSGWWVLISFFPLIGFIVLIVFLVTPSKPANKWGDGPDTPVVAGA